MSDTGTYDEEEPPEVVGGEVTIPREIVLSQCESLGIDESRAHLSGVYIKNGDIVVGVTGPQTSGAQE